MEGEREGEKHQCVGASCTPPTGDLAQGVCVLTGNQTSNSWVHRLALNPLSHTSQGCVPLLKMAHKTFIYQTFAFPSPCKRPPCPSKSQTTSPSFSLAPEWQMSLNCLMGLPRVSYSYGTLHTHPQQILDIFSC